MRHKLQDSNRAVRTLSAPDTLQEHGSLKDTLQRHNDGFASLLLWTLNLVLGPSLASNAHWFFPDAPSTVSRTGGWGAGELSEVTDPGRMKMSESCSCVELGAGPMFNKTRHLTQPN